MSALATAQRPFFFLIDFELEKPVLCPLEDALRLGFKFEVKAFRNFKRKNRKPNPLALSISPIPKTTYTKAYHKVKDEILKVIPFYLTLPFPQLFNPLWT